MSTAEQYEALKTQIDPRKQVICVHVGMTNAEGAPVVAQRVDPDTGGPLLNVFQRKNLGEVLLNGWREYKAPVPPQGVKAARSRRKTKADQ